MEYKKTVTLLVIRGLMIGLIGGHLQACSTTREVLELDSEKAGYKMAEELRANTVHVTGNVDERQNSGLGFIVGEKEKELFIVTANHVVRPKNPKPGQSIPEYAKIEFLGSQGEYKDARIIPLSDDKFDVAILGVSRPVNFEWRKKAIGKPEFELSDNVWTIDPDRSWTVSSEPGSIYKFDPVQITTSGLNISKGHSGGPLISASGVIGMIYDDGNQEKSYAYPLEVIKSRVEDWEKPWNLTKNYTEERNWLWILIGSLVVALALSDGGDDSENTGTLTVAAPLP